MIRTTLLFEWAVLGIGVIVIITQIMMPVLKGRPMFPILRKRGLQLESELAETREQVELSEREQEIAALKQALKPKNRRG